MKKLKLSFLFFIGLTVSLQAQKKEISITIYQTSADFVAKNIRKVNASAIVKEQSSSHIWVKKIIDTSSKKKIKNSDYTWAIAYNGSFYFNLLYSEDNAKPNVFVKLNTIGKYCAIYIDEDSPKKINYGGFTLQPLYNGIGFYKTTKNHFVWKNKNKKWVKILMIDMTKTKKFLLGYANGSTAHFLTIKELEDLTKKPLEKETIFLEDVDTILKKLNKKSM